MQKKLDLAQDDQNLVINEFMKCKGKVTDADKCIKDYQANIRTAEGKLKSLKEVGEDLVTENSKLELELADRKSLITDNTVNRFCKFPCVLTFNYATIFSGKAQ
jgi:hypothetical protein